MDVVRLRPFFWFFGSKWRIASVYPKPLHETIIEPFCGSASYSLANYERNIILYDKNPDIAALWEYLIHATPSEILALPDLEPFCDTRSLNLSHGAAALLGRWGHPGAVGAQPWIVTERGAYKWNSNYHLRERIASQLQYIRHWKITCQSYETLTNQTEATWFIDPPYQHRPNGYGGNYKVDYTKLGAWCQMLTGQVIVCEGPKGNWLSFSPLTANRIQTGQLQLEQYWYKP